MKQRALLFLGRSGSGKGTITRIISESTGWAIISTGDLIRQEAERDTDLGHRCREILKEGLFLDPEEVIALDCKAIIKFSDSPGLLFEGSPRSGEEARFLAGALDSRLVWLDVPKEVCMARLIKRARSYDTPENITKRFEEFNRISGDVREVIAPCRIDGNRPPELVVSSIFVSFMSWFI